MLMKGNLFLISSSNVFYFRGLEDGMSCSFFHQLNGLSLAEQINRYVSYICSYFIHLAHTSTFSYWPFQGSSFVAVLLCLCVNCFICFVITLSSSLLHLAPLEGCILYFLHFLGMFYPYRGPLPHQETSQWNYIITKLRRKKAKGSISFGIQNTRKLQPGVNTLKQIK